MGGVKKLAAVFLGNCAEQNALRDAGDEVAAAFAGGERGHGDSIGLCGSACRGDFVYIGTDLVAEGLSPGFRTKRDGRVRKGGARFVDRVSGDAGWTNG